MPLALIILFGIVGSAALGALPLVSAALIGATLMVMTRIISPGQIYKSINWKIIFLLAGVIPLGIALEKTGTANLISNGILSLTRDLGPRAVLSFFFFSTMMITSVISNQATGALLAPIAIQLARAMAVSPRPFLIAVTFAASLSFLSPIAYQTNTLVYGPGHYKFTDYFRVGIWLNLIFWAVATFMIPLLWEF
jgi:di/tricarboxylate transporter